MNLGLGQSAWTQMLRELGVYMKPIKALRDLSRKLDDSLSRVQLVDNNGSSSVLSGWVLSGVVYGTNTNESGQIYPRVTKDSVATTVAAGSNNVNVNTFTGSGTLNVASTTNFPTSGTLTVATSSGNVVVSYTGTSGGNQFTGCNCTGSGVLSTGGNVSICTVLLYTATGATGLVAQGQGAYTASGTNTITLTAQNASGLSGTVAVGVLAASETADTHYLTVFADFIVNARNVFNGTQIEHGAMLADFRAAEINAQASVKSAISTLQAAMTKFLSTRVSRTINSAQPSLINLNVTNSSGVITTNYSGALEDLRADMADETTPSAQTVLKNVLSAGAATFPATNDGKATLTGPTLSEFAYAGTITATCTDATFGNEQFALTQRVTLTNAIINSKTNVMIDKAYADPNLGILSMTLSRLLTLTAGAAADFGSMNNYSLTGLNSSNVDSNQNLYVKVIAGVVDNTKWIIQLYNASSYASGSLVSQSAEAAANATGVVLSAQNGSNLTGTCAIGSGPTAGHTGTIACNGWKTKNSQKNIADSWTVTVSQTSAGEIQDLVRVLLNYYLNSASSNPTIPDGLASAGTFPPYVVRDV